MRGDVGLCVVTARSARIRGAGGVARASGSRQGAVVREVCASGWLWLLLAAITTC
jgi:hypothetical protein